MEERDKELAKAFCRQKQAEGVCSKRLVKLVHTLYGWRQFLPDKRWEEMTKEDFVDAVLKLNESAYKQNTKVDYKKILKLFYKFVKGTAHPEETDWIKACERRAGDETPNQEILTEDDLKRLIEVTPDVKLRCFWDMLYRGGFRVGELIPIRIGDLAFQENGAVRVAVSGKTGRRNPLVISKYIHEWYALHPARTNKEAFFFLKKNDITLPLSYSCIQKYLAEYAKKAGITKPHHFHWFRHSSVSGKMLREGWSPAESAAYHGHSITTSEKYFHRNASDADGAVLRSQSIVKEKACPRCGSKNSETEKRCTACGSLLDVRYAKEEEEQKKFVIELLVGMLKDENKRKELLGMLEKEVSALDS